MKNVLKAVTTTSVLFMLPPYVAAMNGIVKVSRTASKKGNKNNEVAKQATFETTVFALPSPLSEMAGFAGGLRE